MTESVKAQAAKFAVPLLVGLLPTAFFAGKAWGGNSETLEALSDKVKAVMGDHDLLVRIDERVAAAQKLIEQFVKDAAIALKANGGRPQ